MTHIHLVRDHTKVTVVCRGHATGSVEACAAISTLVQTAVSWAHTAGAVIYSEVLESGHAGISFDAGPQGMTVFDMLHAGFVNLQHKYPQQVWVLAEEII